MTKQKDDKYQIRDTKGMRYFTKVETKRFQCWDVRQCRRTRGKNQVETMQQNSDGKGEE